MLKFNNKVLNINGNWLNADSSPVPPDPVLPDKTIRLKYADGVTPTNHYQTFSYCVANTTAGSAELAQIAVDLK